MKDTIMIKRSITRADILPMDDYRRERGTLRQDMIALKRHRRVEVGPFATFHFENYRTMWHQVHEMLLIEKGGEAQIEGELRAFNPLIPQGGELVATVMFEIDEPIRRAAELARLGGVERHMFIAIGEAMIRGVPEGDTDRTDENGKASSVQFVHFPFSAGQIDAFRAQAARVIVGIDHPRYGHMAALSDEARAALSRDFD
jgi:hypothetical protein